MTNRGDIIQQVSDAMIAAYNDHPSNLTPNEDLSVALTVLVAVFERTAPMIPRSVRAEAATELVEVIRRQLMAALDDMSDVTVVPA